MVVNAHSPGTVFIAIVQTQAIRGLHVIIVSLNLLNNNLNIEFQTTVVFVY